MGAGVDPGTQEEISSALNLRDGKLYLWAGSWFFLNALVIEGSRSTTSGSNANNLDVTEVVGDRTAVTYHEKTDADKEFCDVAFAVEDGSVIVRIDTKGGMTAELEPCAAAIAAASALQTYMPG